MLFSAPDARAHGTGAAPLSVAALNARLVKAGLYRYDCRLPAIAPSPLVPA